MINEILLRSTPGLKPVNWEFSSKEEDKLKST